MLFETFFDEKPVSGPFGAVLVVCWELLSPSWGLLECSWGCFGVLLRPPGVILDPLVSPYSSTGLGANRRGNPSPPLFHSKLTSTSLNLTPLNSTHLNSLFDPPRPPFWSLLASQIDPRSPKIGPSRLLTPHFFKNMNFHETSAGVVFGALPGPQDGTQDEPRSAQDGSKTIFKTFFFRLRFCPRFWSILGPILTSSWLLLGPHF